mgnify:CR=1 FL=1
MNIILIDVPHQGQVVAQYRRAKNWSQEDLAEALRVDVRTVQRMEQQQMIKSIERRKLLVGLLGIPLALMGLESEQELTKRISLAINHDRMSFFENELAARWDLYHTGGTLRAGRNLDLWISEITEFARESQGTGWHERSLALLVMSYQLQICTARDMLDFTQAHKASQKAYQIAKELDDPELIASTLAHDGIAYLQQDRPLDAIKYLNGGLKNVHYAGLSGLRSYILQAVSEAYAKAKLPQESWQSIGLAERALEQRDPRQERGKTHLFASSTLAQKGINAVLLEDYDRALSLIDKGLTSYNPTFVRGRARLFSQKAEALYGSGSIDESVVTAEEAIMLARSVGSNKTIARVQTLHSTLSQSRWRKERSIARLGALLSL